MTVTINLSVQAHSTSLWINGVFLYLCIVRFYKLKNKHDDDDDDDDDDDAHSDMHRYSS